MLGVLKKVPAQAAVSVSASGNDARTSASQTAGKRAAAATDSCAVGGGEGEGKSVDRDRRRGGGGGAVGAVSSADQCWKKRWSGDGRTGKPCYVLQARALPTGANQRQNGRKRGGLAEARAGRRRETTRGEVRALAVAAARKMSHYPSGTAALACCSTAPRPAACRSQTRAREKVRPRRAGPTMTEAAGLLALLCTRRFRKARREPCRVVGGCGCGCWVAAACS